MSANDATVDDWIDQLVFGAVAAGQGTDGVIADRQITVGGVTINDTNFEDFFVVTADGSGGSSLSLVPEPSSVALLGLGSLALMIRRRR